MHPVTTAERTTLASSYNSADQGVLVYDTDLDAFYGWDGNAWFALSLSSQILQQLQEAYHKTVTAVDVTSTETERTVTLTYRDTTSISDVFKFAHVHTQTLASSEWTVVHNLGKHPSVSIVDSAEEEVIGEVQHTDVNSLIIRFSAAFSGKAYLN
jgi:hypothetical protein